MLFDDGNDLSSSAAAQSLLKFVIANFTKNIYTAGLLRIEN